MHRRGRDVAAPRNVELRVGVLLGIHVLLRSVGVRKGRHAGRFAHVRHEGGSPHAVQKAQHAAEETPVDQAERTGKRVRDDGFRPIGLDDLLEAGRDGVDGFIPADALELGAGTLRADALHRVEDAVLRVMVVQVRLPLDARAASRVGVVAVAVPSTTLVQMRHVS